MTQELLEEKEVVTPPEERPRRLSLRDAVRVCGMSEKTLRRKLEAGALKGARETLDYGGFMWMIEARSLAELYPSQELEAYLQGGPEPSPEEETGPISNVPAPLPSSEEHGDFLSYILEQNRELREELKVRDERLSQLHDRTLGLEREVGEQRGTAVTQARVLEWFQQQQQQPAPQPMLPPPAAEIPPPAPRLALRLALLSALSTLILTVALLAASGHFSL